MLTAGIFFCRGMYLHFKAQTHLNILLKVLHWIPRIVTVQRNMIIIIIIIRVNIYNNNSGITDGLALFHVIT